MIYFWICVHGQIICQRNICYRKFARVFVGWTPVWCSDFPLSHAVDSISHRSFIICNFSYNIYPLFRYPTPSRRVATRSFWNGKNPHRTGSGRGVWCPLHLHQWPGCPKQVGGLSLQFCDVGIKLICDNFTVLPSRGIFS